MSSVAVPSRGGSLADLEEVLEVVVIPKQPPLDQWAPTVISMAPLEVQEDFAAVDSEVALMLEEGGADSEEELKIVEVMAAGEEEELAIRAAEASHLEVDMEAEIVVGMGVQTDTEHPLQMLLLALVVHVVVVTAEVVMVAPDLPIAMVLACLHQLVGMTRAEADAHMMTGRVDTVATTVEDTGIVMGPLVVEVVATWSR